MHAEDTQNGVFKQVGKRPLSIVEYEALCKLSFQLHDGGFCHLFLIATWNLMYRSQSTEIIGLDHIFLENDAIGIVFHKTKTQQEGLDYLN